jgi:hypothetical protein
MTEEEMMGNPDRTFINGNRNPRKYGWSLRYSSGEGIDRGMIARTVPNQARVAEDWVLVSEFSVPEPTRFIRRHISFLRAEDDFWRRDEEVHHNVLIDTSLIPAFLSEQGVVAQLGNSFGNEALPTGLVTIIGGKSVLKKCQRLN